MKRQQFRSLPCMLVLALLLGLFPGASALGEEEAVNLAYQKAVTATFTETTATVGTVDPLNVTDGDVSTRWSSFKIPEDVLPAVMIDLDAVVTLSEVDILLYADEREYEFELYLTNEPIVSEGLVDTTGYEPIYSGNGIGSGSVPDLVPTDMSACTVVTIDSAVEGRYLTYVGINISSGAHAMWELEAYGTVKQIVVHDIVSVETCATLGITVTDDITSHLPAAATVSLDNKKTVEVPVVWDLAGYTAGQAGEYHLTGALDLSELPGVSNTKELHAALTVQVTDPREKIQAVETLITAIGELTEENYTERLSDIEAAQQALQELIDAYGEEMAAEVSNREVLTQARAEYERLYALALEREKQAAIQNVESLITAIGEVTEENYITKQESIQTAEDALRKLEADYGAETAAQVSNKADLDEARKQYDELINRPVLTLGDVNDDNSIDASDALLALQHSVNLITLDETKFQAANVDGNDRVDASDALMILQCSVNLIQPEDFPAAKK